MGSPYSRILSEVDTHRSSFRGLAVPSYIAVLQARAQISCDAVHQDKPTQSRSLV